MLISLRYWPIHDHIEVVSDGCAFAGNDVWWGEEPDIGRCCDRCLNMLRKWEDETAELRGETIPSVTDNTCLAYTYSIRTKQCYLKNCKTCNLLPL